MKPTKARFDLFQRVNQLLSHFCTATGYDPSGMVTDHLEELADMLRDGATQWEIHRMIDTFSENVPAEPGAEFRSFKNEFWMNRPNPTLRGLIELTSNEFTPIRRKRRQSHEHGI